MATDITKHVADFFADYPLQTFHKGELLVQAEETPAGVFYIIGGRVSQYDITPSGTEMVVNVFKPGAFFPMSWALNDTPNHYFFEASTTVTVRLAPAVDAVRFLQANPDVMFDLLSRVYRGIDGVLRRTAHLMGSDAKNRLLFELINAAARFGEHQTDGSIFVPLKEGDLARHSGLARETISRTLQQFKADDLVVLQQDGFVLKDIKQLEHALGL